jgi:hypothetical protein
MLVLWPRAFPGRK